ncbi:D-alanyl-D-alanine carboxypeptidase family protein [Anaerobacillus sp. 1_MG-2023]|uniref:D-alanyl-D-alanine carboxypeptidase family protein n=1 Tax=Anaerobacillus sp. 1_MG-2023 TaxID=3062655 RepID=UPI0026E38DC8|nr:D-alanyl-D-alanine carboxypeptidase family protein [Anaerobacillus sp. 1_MG-2023]MDO6655328.1 D-alanyl-D-alanine carboxypeptidase family protein [Anaerobacillus sp. 1_MG-2023]
MKSLKTKIGVFILIAALLFLMIPRGVVAEGIGVSARSAILIEQETGRVLYEKDAYTQRRIASITKIMTAIIAIESGKMNETVKISGNAAGTEGSSLYLKEGEKITLENLVYGLMLRSGNDAAVAIAEEVGGSLEGFVTLMNQKAEEIGMSHTVFMNPHGLDDHENHLSTAYDMAILTQYAMDNDTYRIISSTKVHKAPNATEDWDYVWRNKNKLLTSLYSDSTGGKTGYTKRAKRTLVSTAERDGMTLIAVTLNAPDDWNDHISMFNWGYSNYELTLLEPKGIIKDVKDEPYKGNVRLNRDLSYPLTSEERDQIDSTIQLVEPPDESKWDEMGSTDDPVGMYIVKLNNKTIVKAPITFDSVEKKEKGLWGFFKGLFSLDIGREPNG